MLEWLFSYENYFQSWTGMGITKKSKKWYQKISKWFKWYTFRAHMARHAEVRPHAQVRRNQIFELKCNLTTKKIESQSLKK